MTFRSGFVALVGRPNCGKSTLLNALVQHKIAIVSSKPQTTRNVIRGILTDKESQIIFLDTPGIHKPQHKLGQQMNKESISSIFSVDLVYYLVDITAPFGRGDEFVLQRIKQLKSPCFLIVNKIDRCSKEQLIQRLSDWQQRHDFAEIIPISALQHDNIDRLLQVTKTYLKDTVQYYPEEQTSDNPMAFLVSEIIREKYLSLTEDEIPHSLAVYIENLQLRNTAYHIDAAVVVERDSQKGIVIGKNGALKKEVLKQASIELRELLKTKIVLNIYVLVEKDWRNKEKYLSSLGYKPDYE